MNKPILLSALAGIAISTLAFSSPVITAPKKLRVVIVRHGEKPDAGDNLSCQGMNRALQLPDVLCQKFDLPDYVYVPSLKCSTTTTSARMFQTVTPFAIKYNLAINSTFDEKDYKNLAADVLQKTGMILMVWEHSAIPHIARHLGIEDPPPWEDPDFDSIWIIEFTTGKASLTIEQEGIIPASECSF